MNAGETTYVEKLEETYKTALATLDTDLPKLIADGKEMQGLIVCRNCLTVVSEVHQLLNDLYEFVYHGKDVLARFSSTRFNSLSYELPLTFSFIKGFGGGDMSIESIDNDHADGFLENILATGVSKKEHWAVSTIILTEIEFMLKVLKVLIEPDFVPLEESSLSTEGQSDVNRHISRSVKISVWQRDLGRCVECSSKEKLEYDHIIPISKGGSNTERNIQLLCEKCNRKKSATIG